MALKDSLRSYFAAYIAAHEREGREPRVEWKEISRYTRSYVEAHGGATRFVPIGFDANHSLLVVVDNENGAVMLEDDERGSVEVLAANLEELVDHLTASLGHQPGV